jgi:hypothetical protein
MALLTTVVPPYLLCLYRHVLVIKDVSRPSYLLEQG